MKEETLHLVQRGKVAGNKIINYRDGPVGNDKEIVSTKDFIAGKYKYVLSNYLDVSFYLFMSLYICSSYFWGD